MTVDVAFEFAKVFDITNLEVVVGQKFTLLTDYSGGRWFSDNDPVLTLKVSDTDAEVSADATGLTTVLIMDNTFAIQKQLTINVVNDIVPMAKTLGPVMDETVPK